MSTPKTAPHASPAASRQTGRLFLVPTPLDFGMHPDALAADAPAQDTGLLDVLPYGVIRQTAQLTHWVVENAKTARAFLKRVHAVVPLAKPLQELQLAEIPRAAHKDAQQRFDARPFLQAALQGHDVGLMSEAGMPAVADPGSDVVLAAHGLAIPVVPLVGPSALLLALAASGLNGQHFAFVGYLPQKEPERQQRIQALEQLAMRQGQAQLFIETPYRNAALWAALLQHLQGQTWLSVTQGTTTAQALHMTRRVSEWREHALEWPAKVPAVFVLGRA